MAYTYGSGGYPLGRPGRQRFRAHPRRRWLRRTDRTAARACRPRKVLLGDSVASLREGGHGSHARLHRAGLQWGEGRTAAEAAEGEAPDAALIRNGHFFITRRRW
ncbi:MAG: hypothetical protein MZV70_44490 [Desulfobacterales bacterium]|nr:hypothetical protein [Desulfobacterales bacterium]